MEKQYRTSGCALHDTRIRKERYCNSQIIEKYLNNQKIESYPPNTPSFPLSSHTHSLLSKAHLNQLKPLLHNIDNIRCMEIPLYSDQLRLAGTCDCIAEYNDKLSIIDFKTSRKQKKSLGFSITFCRERHMHRCMSI